MRRFHLVLLAVLTALPLTLGTRVADIGTPADPSGQNPPVLVGQNVQVYVDEFTEPTLGTDWAVLSNSGSSTRGPKSKAQTFTHDGLLTLRVGKLGGVWTGSGVSSRTVHGTYGEVIIRARFAHGYGVKAVGLLWPMTGWPPEIDFLEYDARDPLHRKLALTNHYSSANRMQHDYVAATSGWHVHVVPGFDSADWHTYDLSWTPDAVTYRIDDTTVAQSGHSPSVEMRLGLSNNLGHGAKPNDTTPDPVDFDIDWVDYLRPV